MEVLERVNLILNAPLALTTTLGNALILAAVLAAIWKTPSLHYATNALMFSLSLSDLGVGLISQPLIIVLYFLKVSINEVWLKMTVRTIIASFSAVSLLTVTAIGVDRYLAPRLHLRYKEFVTTKTTIYVLVIIWVACIFTLSFWFWLSGHISSLILFYCTAAPVIVTCFLINIFVYQKLYRVCRFHHARIQDQAVFQDTQLYQRAVNEARFRKSVRTIFLILLLFVCCYLPFCCCAVAVVVIGQDVTSVVRKILPLTWTIVFANSTVNPILLYFQLTELRLAIKRILKQKACGHRQKMEHRNFGGTHSNAGTKSNNDRVKLSKT